MSDFIPATPLPDGGVRVFPGGRHTAMRLRGLADDRLRVLPAKGLPFDEIIDVDVDRQGETPWAFLLISKVDAPVAANDVVHVRFWARCALSMTGSARLAIAVEDFRGDQPGKFAELPVTVGTQWQCVALPLTIPRAYDAEQWHFSIRLGYAPQHVQVGGVEVLNYGSSVPVDRLPRVRSSYDGRADDAPWRAAAMARIEQLRKGDLRVRVTDEAGRPLAGATVRATLQRHAFGFGTCVSMTLLEDSPDADRYRQMIPELFSCAVIENELKWQAIRGHHYANSDALIDWLIAAGLPTRGHVLLWPGERYMPADVVVLADRPDEMRRVIAEHIERTVTRYRGRLGDWDVINEPYAHHFAMDVLGAEAMADWFHQAHAADPAAKLYINDYEILESGDRLDTPHQNHFYDTAKFLKDRDAPLHGVGIQGHFGSNITSPENMLRILDRFAALGLRIKITELDVQISDEALQADYFRDVLITLFGHPAVDAIMQWGFWEGSHWIPSTAMYRRDWSLRPHGRVFLDLVHGQWRTNETVLTDANGDAVVRGFHGTYVVSATTPTGVRQVTATLETAGTRVELRALS